MGDRLLHFALHNSMLLFRYSFSLPHLLFILHTSPACSLLSSLLSVSINVNCPSWIQASLPIRLGGLGFRSAEQLAPSCYLSSAAASRCLVNLILSTTSLSQMSSRSDEALSVWSSKFPSHSPPAADKASILKEWDNPQVLVTLDCLLDFAPDEVCLARLTAVSAPEAGAWLQSLPVSSFGLRLDDSFVRICVALRLGLPVCVPHLCRHCGAQVCRLGLHGLSCKRGNMRFHRQAAVNDLICWYPSYSGALGSL